MFENIPGKIILKKDIQSNTGIKGIEIVNKTRRGDVQHYQIYFTDLEMILFKLGGKHDYAIGNEAKQFFNSIQFVDKSDKNVNFSPATKGFSVSIANNHSYTKHTGSSLIGLVEDLFGHSKVRKQFFGVQHAVYNDFNYLEEDTFELNQLAKSILSNYNFKEAQNYKAAMEQGVPCVRFSAKNGKGTNLYAKVFIKGVHYYYVYLISESGTSFEHEFLNPFN